MARLYAASSYPSSNACFSNTIACGKSTAQASPAASRPAKSIMASAEPNDTASLNHANPARLFLLTETAVPPSRYKHPSKYAHARRHASSAFPKAAECRTSSMLFIMTPAYHISYHIETRILTHTQSGGSFQIPENRFLPYRWLSAVRHSSRTISAKRSRSTKRCAQVVYITPLTREKGRASRSQARMALTSPS